MYFWIVFLTALVLSLVFTPISIWLAPKIGAVDIPRDSRRMHSKPMPRFGGFAIFIGTMTSIGVFLGDNPKTIGILTCGTLIYALGIIDDLKGMPAKVKFAGQIAIACVSFGFGIRITFITEHFMEGQEYTFFSGAGSFILTIAWIVGITNTVNLIDGLDGLAAGIAAIAALSIAYTAYIHTPGVYPVALAMLALAGGALGFLPYNFHPAKIFMGDGGSLFLGFMLATLSIEGPAKGATVVAAMVPILVLGVPIFDTAFAILRRLINHRPIMEADKGHLHHRIMETGIGQRRTVLTLYGISGVLGVAAVLFSRDLFVEMFGLLAVAAMFIYIFLTDSDSWRLKLKAVNIAELEKHEKKEEISESFDSVRDETGSDKDGAGRAKIG